MVTCRGVRDGLTRDARRWFLELVSGVGRRCRWAGVTAGHVVRWIRRAVIILGILTLAKAGIRRIVLPNQSTGESRVKAPLLVSHTAHSSRKCCVYMSFVTSYKHVRIHS